MNECRHEKTGRGLAAVVASYGNQREISRMAGDQEYVDGWISAIQDVKDEMRVNWENHLETCGARN